MDNNENSGKILDFQNPLTSANYQIPSDILLYSRLKILPHSAHVARYPSAASLTAPISNFHTQL